MRKTFPPAALAAAVAAAACGIAHAEPAPDLGHCHPTAHDHFYAAMKKSPRTHRGKNMWVIRERFFKGEGATGSASSGSDFNISPGISGHLDDNADANACVGNK